MGKESERCGAFDRWFLNLFPQSQPFVCNAGGYLTLNFIPSLATMILGLVAGSVLQSDRRGIAKFWWLVWAGIACLVLGALWDASELCPMVKRIWTPSFAVFSAGWAFVLLAIFYGIIELKGYRRWAFPFMVAGMNSFALYCMSMLMKPWIRERLKLHLGQDIFAVFGATFARLNDSFGLKLQLDGRQATAQKDGHRRIVAHGDRHLSSDQHSIKKANDSPASAVSPTRACVAHRSSARLNRLSCHRPPAASRRR